MQCLIIDDEPLSRKVLEKFLEELPGLELVGSCSNAFSARPVLQEQSVDLMLLDINMPKMSGISFLKTLLNPPLVIFTTAYPEYALEGYELNVVDYLMKPIGFDRFLRAVNKAEEIFRMKKSAQIPSSKDRLFVKADKKLYRLSFDEILFLESYGDYVKIHTTEKVLVALGRLKTFLEELPGDSFFQVHKSFVIPLSKIEYVEGHQLKIAGRFIPIGASFKKRAGEIFGATHQADS